MSLFLFSNLTHRTQALFFFDILWPLLKIGKWAEGCFTAVYGRTLVDISKNGQKKWPIGQIWEMEVATEKVFLMLNSKLLGVFGRFLMIIILFWNIRPLTHFYSLLTVKENNRIYTTCGQQSGQVANRFKNDILMSNTGTRNKHALL